MDVRPNKRDANRQIYYKEEKQVAVKEKIRVRLKSYDHTLIDAAAEKIVEVAKRNGATVSGPIPLPTEKEIVTILRAVHKYKDSREQFEMRTHKRLIDIVKPSQKVVETAKRNGSKVSGPIPLPTDREIVTILRAVHKYKDSREQFEMRTHKRLIDILEPQQKTVEALMNLELPAGVEIEIKA